MAESDDLASVRLLRSPPLPFEPRFLALVQLSLEIENGTRPLAES